MPNLTSITVTGGIPTAGTGTVSTIDGLIASGIGLTATQNVVGNVGGKTKSVANTLTIGGTTYGTNYSVGGIQTFANAFTSTGSGIIQSIWITCGVVETNSLSFTLFSANPANAIADNAAASINSADVGKVVAIIPLTPVSNLGTHTLWSAYGLGLSINTGATSLYGLVTSNTAFSSSISGATVVANITTLQDA